MHEAHDHRARAPISNIDAQLLRRILLVLFTLSGGAGLMYQILWVRQFTLLLGASTYAVTIVLAVFMAGLGLGAWLFGKVADRFDEHKLARSYVLLEIGIGLYALMLPWMLAWAQGAYTAFCQFHGPSLPLLNALRLVLAFLLLIVPTTLMGATLPVLSRYIVRTKAQIPVTVSWLYGLNTVGALVGAVAAGYLLLPTLGIAITNLLAVGVNFLVAIAFWSVHWLAASTTLVKSLTESGGSVAVRTQAARKLTGGQKSALAAFAISGFAAMLYEVAWTRTLTMILGTTTFSFTTMVATFLLGIALGSVLFSSLRKLASPTKLLVWLQYVVGFSVLLSIPLFEILPMLYLSLDEITGESWVSVQLVRFLLAALVMLVPTLALGATFPAVAAVLVGKTEILGRRLGDAYGFNTVGSVLGALLGGLLLVPLLGLKNTIVLGAVLNLAAGSLIALSAVANSVRSRVVPVCCATLGLLVMVAIVGPWSPRVISSGVYVYADRYQKIIDRVESASDLDLPISDMSTWQIWQAAMNQYDLLYYKVGLTSTVAVMERHDGVRFLSIDGKTDASTAKAHDMKTQVMLGQLPMLFHPNPDKILVVGLGSGVTVGSVLTHDVRLVDCAELSGAVIEASEFFSSVNHRPLEDDRLHLMRRDARNVLLTSDDRYDAIISQPSNPWISGQSSLFSLEWYQLVRDRLGHEGMLAQWLPAYHMSCRDVKVIMHTMRHVFPETTVWTSGAGGDLILIAKKGAELRIDYPCLVDRASRPAVRADLACLGFEPADLLPTTFVMNASELGAFLYSDLEGPLPMNTDDLLVTEFSTPKHMVEDDVARRFADPKRLQGDMLSLLAIVTNVKQKPHLDKVRN